jgi:hypothetical protein
VDLSNPVACHAFLDEMEKLSADAATRRRMRGEFKGPDALAYSSDGLARKKFGQAAAEHTSKARRSKSIAENAARNLDKPGRQRVVQVQANEAVRQAAIARRAKDAGRTGRSSREFTDQWRADPDGAMNRQVARPETAPGPPKAEPGRILKLQEAKRAAQQKASQGGQQTASRAERQAMYEDLFKASPASPAPPQASKPAPTPTARPPVPAPTATPSRLGTAGKVGLGLAAAGALVGGGVLAGRASKQAEMKKVAGLPPRRPVSWAKND